MQALVHLGAGIGNIVFATPLLVALNELDFTVDLRLSADYEATAGLLTGWSMIRNLYTGRDVDKGRDAPYDAVIPAVPPFYWRRFRHLYRATPRMVARPPDALFVENEQAWYLAFAQALGYPLDRHPVYRLPIGPKEYPGVSPSTVVLAPGCKTGEMAFKRWPWFTRLADLLPDVAVVGTPDDLVQPGRPPLEFPPHTASFVGRLSLRETAELIAGAGMAVANDSGLAYVAAAVGTPTVILFGPTPDRTLGPMPPHVTVIRSGLDCEPCWFGMRFERCSQSIDCLRRLAPERVASAALRLSPLVEALS